MTDSNERLKIPAKLKVGFQKREDTYSNKLAYVTYINDKDEIAKEKSWRGWIRERDYPIEDYDNTPLEGFVLNKKAGGYASGWNHRNTYCRVYDPRGFEIEISVENLLYILQECTSSKGKGLEGEFVYAWDGKDLVLLPVSSPDYIASMDLQTKSEVIKPKDLKIGALYKGKESETLVYVGKIDFDKVSSFTPEQRNRFKFSWSGNLHSGSYCLSEGKQFTFYDPEAEKLYTYKTIGKRLDYLKEEDYMPLSDIEDLKDKFFNLYQFRFGKGAKKIYIDISRESRWEKYQNEYVKSVEDYKTGYYDIYLYRVSDKLIYTLKPQIGYQIDGMDRDAYLAHTFGKRYKPLMQYMSYSNYSYYDRYRDQALNNYLAATAGSGNIEEDIKLYKETYEYFDNHHETVLKGFEILNALTFGENGIYDDKIYRGESFAPEDIDTTKVFGNVDSYYNVILEYEDGSMLTTKCDDTLSFVTDEMKAKLF